VGRPSPGRGRRVRPAGAITRFAISTAMVIWKMIVAAVNAARNPAAAMTVVTMKIAKPVLMTNALSAAAIQI